MQIRIMHKKSTHTHIHVYWRDNLLMIQDHFDCVGRKWNLPMPQINTVSRKASFHFFVFYSRSLVYVCQFL